ncbi:MAG: hypothetical protein RMM31_09310 [Anaerolineae bacterium]|nr:hypothetical protein [Anaerolineae bacterium]
MNYGHMFFHALRIALTRPALWVLGLFTTLLAAFTILLVFQAAFPISVLTSRATLNFTALLQPPALAIAAILGLIGLLAEGCLIAGVQQVAAEGRLRFSRALRLGLSRFISLLLLSILLLLPIALAGGLFLFGVVSSGLFGAAGETVSERLSHALEAPAVWGWAVGILLPYMLFASGVWTLGNRAIVIEHYGALSALRRGARLLFKEFSRVLSIALVLLLFMLLSILLVYDILPRVLLYLSAALGSAIVGSRNGDGLLMVIVIISIIIAFIPVQALLLSLVGAVISAVWTLAYREFMRRDAPAVTSVPSVQANS